MIVLIHPENGNAQSARSKAEFEYLVLGGYRPLGEKAQTMAATILQGRRR